MHTWSGAPPRRNSGGRRSEDSNVAELRSGTKVGLAIALIALVFLVLVVFQGGGEPEREHAIGDASDEPEVAAPRERAPRVSAASSPQPTEAEEPAEEEGPATVRTGVARAGWGSGRGELGRIRPDEANPEAPMSLAEGTDGSVVVLDQVNRRLVRFDREGEEAGTTPLSMEAPQDHAIAADGTTAVLDRLVDRTVTILSPDGQTLGSLPVEGEGIPEGGGVTAVMIDGEDVYVERENGPLVRIGDTSGRAADERAEIPGRPTRDGLSFLLAGLIEPAAGRFYVSSIERSSREHRFTREITLPLFLRQITLLDTDNAGIIYVAVAGTPYGADEEVEEGRLLCLAPGDGSTIGATPLPANTDPDETMREMIVLATGGVLYSMRSDEGVAIGFFDCRTPQ